MLYQIHDGSVSAGGNLVLSHFDFQIRGNEKVAVAGQNGAGKTTLLRLIAGDIGLDRDDRRDGPGVRLSRPATVGMLGQQVFKDGERTVEEEILEGCPDGDEFGQERFQYECGYETLFTGFGFRKEDKKRKLSEFSGGEQTRIALIRLLLQKPDILLLDEPTNHLDTEMTEWLEEYLKKYEKAVVMVSHDRFFLDQTAEAVWELEGGKATRYPGNYSAYRMEKRKRLEIQQKAWEQQQREIARLSQVIERFKHKPSKASFARAKKKQLERMEKAEAPVREEPGLFTTKIHPKNVGGRLVFEAEHLKIGYEKPLLELSLRIRRGQKIGVIGANGAGKSTFLKTVAGVIPALGGKAGLGRYVTVGYFGQDSADIRSDKSVLEHFCELFPILTEKEARGILGSYLFKGRDASKRVSDLSGGEKARLVLAEILQAGPNFLILDEPTNHMDIPARETLESAFRAYTGTVLFVSHDRYFIRQVAESVLIFEGGQAFYHPFGYEHYLEKVKKSRREGMSVKRGMMPGGTGERKELSSCILAEDQALLESLRSVPKAERGRMREFSEKEMYEDWLMGPAREKMEEAGRRYEEKIKEAGEFLRRWQESEEFWENEEEPDERVKEYEKLVREAGDAWAEWHEGCMEWYDSYLQGS